MSGWSPHTEDVPRDRLVVPVPSQAGWRLQQQETDGGRERTRAKKAEKQAHSEISDQA